MAVLMRYTLRLLTTQQFQRAATLMCAAELLRQHLAKTDSRYEGEPFRLGMWVGSSVSPNRSQDAQRFTEDSRLGTYSSRQSTPSSVDRLPLVRQGNQTGYRHSTTTLFGSGSWSTAEDTQECPFNRDGTPRAKVFPLSRWTRSFIGWFLPL